MSKVKPLKSCEICYGEGYVEEHESFQNAYGEHGLKKLPCICLKRKQKPTPEGEKEGE